MPLNEVHDKCFKERCSPEEWDAATQLHEWLEVHCGSISRQSVHGACTRGASTSHGGKEALPSPSRFGGGTTGGTEADRTGPTQHGPRSRVLLVRCQRTEVTDCESQVCFASAGFVSLGFRFLSTAAGLVLTMSSRPLLDMFKPRIQGPCPSLAVKQREIGLRHTGMVGIHPQMHATKPSSCATICESAGESCQQ